METICYNCFSQINGPPGPCPNCGYDAAADTGKYPLALAAGSILNGRYVLGRVLGQGGFGITYIAQDVQTDQRVSIKEYFPETMATRTKGYLVTAFTGQRQENFTYGMQCFLSEAQTLAQFIGNENIVRVHSYFEENGTAYFVMDYVDGISLKHYLNQHGKKISWEDAIKIIFPVMDALSVVHSKGIIHRDIAPDNIYITTDGKVKLLDFGAARYSLGDRSRSLDVVLKAGFAPMEQYTRRGRQGPYTDVYSLAATMYIAITGRLPPESVDRMEEDMLVPPSSYGVKIPAEAEEALEKALSVRAMDRYQTMAEFRNALSMGQADPGPLPPLDIRHTGITFPPTPVPTSVTIPKSTPKSEVPIKSEERPGPVSEVRTGQKTVPIPASEIRTEQKEKTEEISIPVSQPRTETTPKTQAVPASLPENSPEPAPFFEDDLAEKIVTLVTENLEAPPTPPQEPPKTEPEKKPRRALLIGGIAAALALVVLLGTMIGRNRGAKPAETKAPETIATTAVHGPKVYQIGVAIYQDNNSFLSQYREEIKAYFASLETDTVSYELTMASGENSTALQESHIDSFIEQGMDAIICNLVDTAAADAIISKTVAADIPLILINQEPQGDTFASYPGIVNNPKVCYVGTDPRQAGTIQGEIILDLRNKGDINQDGTIKYLMITGDPQNPDAQYRSEYAIKALTDAGVRVTCLDEKAGDGTREQAKQITASALSQYGWNLEVIFCNNDEMALGAAEAIAAANRTVGKNIYLVGIDALEECQEMVQAGTLTGTVLNDYISQARKAADVAIQALNGEAIENYYWVDSVKLAAEDAETSTQPKPTTPKPTEAKPTTKPTTKPAESTSTKPAGTTAPTSKPTETTTPTSKPTKPTEKPADTNPPKPTENTGGSNSSDDDIPKITEPF